MRSRRAQTPPASRQRHSPKPPVIPDDLMVEILSWLPVKSLLQFRCVCKSWNSLISDPNFVKLHLHRSARNPNLLLVWERVIPNPSEYVSDLSVIPYSLRSLLRNPSSTIDRNDCYSLNDDSCYEVVGSCNGLVCLRGDSYQNNFREYYLYLWNPATKCTSKHLTDSGARSYYRFAFGYDNLSDIYKVVAFTFDGKDKESEKIQVKICSLSDNCWRSIHSFPVIPFDTSHVPRQNNGVYFNGTLNWLALCNINSDDNWNNTVTIAQMLIVSLDLGMETYTQLLLPHVDESPQTEPTIGILMDCLCFSHDCKRNHLAVWKMEEFGVEKSWTQFMKISYQDLQIDCLDRPFPLLPMCMSKDGEVLIMANVGELQAILYHWRDSRIERTELPNYIFWSGTKNYVESLVSPCCN